MTIADYALLRAFRAVFEGVPYYHRNPNTGDKVAQYLYEDLYTLAARGASSGFPASRAT